MKHTKGPWKVNASDNAIRRLTGAKTPEEQKANAHLIAAAPELLEACKLLVNFYDQMRAKARGLVGFTR